jgi:CTP synthase
MVGTQFHPEFRTRLQHPHPLFCGLINAAIDRQTART